MGSNTQTAYKLGEFWHGEVLLDHPLSAFSAIRVGGPADAVVFPKARRDLSELIYGLNVSSLPFWVIGRGSNVLFPDEGLRGVVVVIGSGLSDIEIVQSEGSCRYVRVEAGCSLTGFVGWCVEHCLTGLEFACGIPGSVGGAVAGNAGAWGNEIGNLVSSITLMDRKGDLYSREREQIRFSYRSCDLGRPQGHREDDPGMVLVVETVFKLESGDREKIEALCREFTRRRKGSQPQGVPSVGSFFRNPENQAAGRLIEEAGLKGVCIGGAQVSFIHANFIVNTGKATSKDITDLMRLIQKRVWNRSGIHLEPEVRILGAHPEAVRSVE